MQQLSEFQIRQLKEYDRKRYEVVARLSKFHPSLYFLGGMRIQGDKIDVFYTREQEEAIATWEKLVQASINAIEKPEFLREPEKLPSQNNQGNVKMNCDSGVEGNAFLGGK